MTLFVVILFGLGAVLMISGFEDVALVQTIKEVWSGKSPTTGSTGGSMPYGSLAYPSMSDMRLSQVQAWVDSQGH